MSDAIVNKLKRQLDLHPENIELRAEYFRVLVRLGRDEEKAIQLASTHGDAIALLALGPNHNGQRIQSDSDLALLRDLATPLPNLNLRGCSGISGTGLAYLKGLEVKSLDISGVDGFYNDPDVIDVLKSFTLDSFGLWDCEYFDQQEIDLFKDFPLHSLDLSERQIRSNDVISMVNSGMDPDEWVTQLLQADQNEPEPDPLIHFLPHSSLRFLDLSNTDVDLSLFLEALPSKSLKSLILKRCNNLSDDDLELLTPLSLTHLDLAFCHGVLDDGIGFLKDLPLRSLSLEGCSNLSNAAFKHLASLPLEELHLWRCGNVDNTTLSFLSGLPLRKLNLWGCDKITDAGLSSLKDCPLEDLNLGGCRKITKEALRTLNIERIVR